MREYPVKSPAADASGEASIIGNLIDAGCEKQLIERFMDDIRKEKLRDGLKLLALHRSELLEALHREQKRIDCLDYLVYKMTKENSL